MANEIRPEYKCTQDELYSITETIIDNLSDNLAAFVAYKAKYTAAFVTALRAKRDAAMLLPSMDARDDVSETLRLEMLPFAQECLKSFQFLKGYIEDAFPKEQWFTKYDAAGLNKYGPAASGNWEELVGMNTAMNAFIAANTAVLTASGFMPAAFAASVTTASTNFTTKYSAFKVARQTGVDTNAKIAANNDLYGDVMRVCDDAHSRVYINDDVKKRLFTWKDVKFLVSPPGSASLKITVKRQTDNTLVEAAAVTIQSAGGVPIVLNTDAQGEVVFSSIDPADYNVKIEASGYLTSNFVKEVNTGVDARKDVAMVVD